MVLRLVSLVYSLNWSLVNNQMAIVTHSKAEWVTFLYCPFFAMGDLWDTGL